MTSAQKNDWSRRQNCIDLSGFSKKGLIKQLSSKAGDGYSKKDAKFAANNVGAGSGKAEAVELGGELPRIVGVLQEGPYQAAFLGGLVTDIPARRPTTRSARRTRTGRRRPWSQRRMTSTSAGSPNKRSSSNCPPLLVMVYTREQAHLRGRQGSLLTRERTDSWRGLGTDQTSAQAGSITGGMLSCGCAMKVAGGTLARWSISRLVVAGTISARSRRGQKYVSVEEQQRPCWSRRPLPGGSVQRANGSARPALAGIMAVGGRGRSR